MNFSAGLYHTIYHPRLIVIPLLMNVFLTFISVLGAYFGFTLYPVPTIELGQSQNMTMNATFPIWMPQLDDVKFPFHFLGEHSANNHIALTIVAITLVMIVKSYMLGMYLGSMKGFLKGPDNTYSTLKIGKYYLKRMLVLSIIELIVIAIFFLLAVLFIPLAVIGLIGLLFYSLTPYIIILEDISVSEAIGKAPRIFKKNFKTLFLLALSTMFFTFFLTMLPIVVERGVAYYFILLGYCFIGTVMIFAVMNCLHGAIHDIKLPVKSVKKSRYLYPLLSIVTFLLPLLGVWLASGQIVKIFDLREKTTLSGIHYTANWSDAFYASEKQYTTYDWDTENKFEIKISLPDFSNGKEYDEIIGTGSVKWLIDEEKRVTNGNTTHIFMEPTDTETDFMFRLVKQYTNTGEIYYSSKEGSSSDLEIRSQGHEPLSLELMVSGDGQNVYLYHYPKRFMQVDVFNVDNSGNYLIPKTSSVNPDDFKYFWFSKSITTNDIFKLTQSKNDFTAISSERLTEQLAAALQEANGTVIKNIQQTLDRAQIQHNLPNWSIEEWNEYLENEYKNEPFDSVLKYLSQAGSQFSYELKELPTSEAEIIKYELEIPFPKKIIKLQETLDNDGVLKELNIEL